MNHYPLVITEQVSAEQVITDKVNVEKVTVNGGADA
jgi:hypothetical protein